VLSGFAGGSFKSFQTRAAVIFKERERGLRKYHRNGGFCGFYLAFEKGVTEFCLDDVNVSSSAVKIGRSKMYQVTIKGGDVFSYVGNANVGHSDDNFVVGKRHRRARLKTS
jgi:hypothetical protein